MADSWIRRKRWEYREQLSITSDPMRGLDAEDAKAQPEQKKASAPAIQKEQPSAEHVFANLAKLGMVVPPIKK